jgi:hypothetical protein
LAGIEKGPIFRRVLANGRVGKDAFTERAVWQLVREYAAQIGIAKTRVLIGIAALYFAFRELGRVVRTV